MPFGQTSVSIPVLAGIISGARVGRSETALAINEQDAVPDRVTRGKFDCGSSMVTLQRHRDDAPLSVVVGSVLEIVDYVGRADTVLISQSGADDRLAAFEPVIVFRHGWWLVLFIIRSRAWRCRVDGTRCVSGITGLARVP